MKPQRKRPTRTMVLADPEEVQVQATIGRTSRKTRIPTLDEIHEYTRTKGLFLKPGRVRP